MAKKTILCPYCFNHFDNVDAEYQCENFEMNASRTMELCPSESDPKYNQHWGYEGAVTKHFFKGKKPLLALAYTPKPAKCDKCGMPSTRFVCPHCHNWLPTEMIEEGSEIISIIGAPSSGKTVYFLSLIHELKRVGYKLGLTVRAKDEAPNKEMRTSVVYNRLSSNLFDDHMLPDETHVSERQYPLIFKLISSKNPGTVSKDDKSIYLVFYDTAGEAFESSEQIDRMAKHLVESSGIILLVDPFSIKKLRTRMATAGIPLPESSKVSVFDALANMIEKVGADKKFLNKYMALTFSKFDAVDEGLEACGENRVMDMSKNSPFLKSGIYSIDDTHSVDGRLDKFARDICDLGQMVHDVGTKFDRANGNLCLFAVSSLGMRPDGSNVEDIEPYRVLDPLVWILHKMGGFHIPV